MNTITNATLRRIKAERHHLTRQQFLTLRGQVLAGDGAGAMRGLQSILTRKEANANGN